MKDYNKQFDSWEHEKDYHESWNYTDLIRINGMTIAISKFIFSYGVIIGLERDFYKGRFCFDTYLNAKLFLDDYIKSNGELVPLVGEDGCTAIKI